MSSLLTFTLLFLLPFLIAPIGITQFEDPKVIGAEIGVIILLFASVFSSKFSLKERKEQVVLYSCIFLLTIIDLLFLRTNLSFFGNVFRMQGIFLVWILLLFSFFSSQINLKSIPWWIFFLLLVIEFIAMFFLPLNASHRYVGTLGEPNALAGFAIFLWSFIWFSQEKRPLIVGARCIVLLLVSAILVLSDSRSAMIAFGIQIVFLVGANDYLPLRSVKGAAVVCLILYLMSYALPFFDQAPYENRVEVWKSASFAGVIQPAFGYGFGNTEIAIHNSAAGLYFPIQYYYVDSSHNMFLDWLVQGGMIAISLLVYLVYRSFKTFIEQSNIRNLVLLLGVLTTVSFNPASVVELLAFWWLIGQGMQARRIVSG